MRTPLAAGNWKLHHTASDAVAFADRFAPQVADVTCDVWLFPAFPAIGPLLAHANNAFAVGAQNVSEHESGAFTGEVSVSMLADVGASVVLIGHSERRHVFGETDERIAAKVAAIANSSLTPVLCVGETLAEREAQQSKARIATQLQSALKEVPAERLQNLVVAYEPVWAIGTGETATPALAQEMHQEIRAVLNDLDLPGDQIRVLYGGSVKPDNVTALMAEQDVDGVLVGGASLKADSFAQITVSVAAT